MNYKFNYILFLYLFPVNKPITNILVAIATVA